MSFEHALGRYLTKNAIAFDQQLNALFLWQKPDDEVNAKAGRVIAAHCERAFWKEVLRRELPPEYGKI